MGWICPPAEAEFSEVQKTFNELVGRDALTGVYENSISNASAAKAALILRTLQRG
jgi:hypothetical protein